jgi:SAM-dependent methyltransferase
MPELPKLQKINFEEPLSVATIHECGFYHVMQLPRTGLVGCGWDLRKNVDIYLGNLDWQGKRALDIGAASGYLTFEMEKRGADVVSFDIVDGASIDVVPYVSIPGLAERERAAYRERVQAVKRAYWWAHRELHSSAKAFYGDIYDLPPELGSFDVVVMGMVLSHLRDPFRGLESAARLSADLIVVTQEMFDSEAPLANLMPDPEAGSPTVAWWGFSRGCIARMLEVLGFEIASVTTGMYACVLDPSTPEDGTMREVTTIVGRRKPSGIPYRL